MPETTSTAVVPASPTSLVVRGYVGPIDANQPDPFIDPCPAWCRDFASGHPIEDYDVDRLHMSEEHNVEHRFGTVDRDGPRVGGCGSAVWLPWLRLYLMRRNGERDPRIHLGINDDAGMELTPAEAVALSDVLRDLAKQAEQ